MRRCFLLVAAFVVGVSLLYLSEAPSAVAQPTPPTDLTKGQQGALRHAAGEMNGSKPPKYFANPTAARGAFTSALNKVKSSRMLKLAGRISGPTAALGIGLEIMEWIRGPEGEWVQKFYNTDIQLGADGALTARVEGVEGYTQLDGVNDRGCIGGRVVRHAGSSPTGARFGRIRFREIRTDAGFPNTYYQDIAEGTTKGRTDTGTNLCLPNRAMSYEVWGDPDNGTASKRIGTYDMFETELVDGPDIRSSGDVQEGRSTKPTDDKLELNDEEAEQLFRELENDPRFDKPDDEDGDGDRDYDGDCIVIGDNSQACVEETTGGNTTGGGTTNNGGGTTNNGGETTIGVTNGDGDGDTDGDGDADYTCVVASPRSDLEGPGEGYKSLFPFNLIAMVGDTIEAVRAPPTAPPMPQQIPGVQASFSLSYFDDQAAISRLVFSVAGTIGAGLALYRMFSSSKEGD